MSDTGAGQEIFAGLPAGSCRNLLDDRRDEVFHFTEMEGRWLGHAL